MIQTSNTNLLSHWLFACCALIVVMIVVGAITRLTESGLSIVDWHAFKDMTLPVSAEAWEKLFAAYQQTPEYIKKNHGMDLAAFKQIYFWEWLHRLLGRLIGLVYALPLAYFGVRKKIPNELKPRLFGFLLLGGLQGFIGWFMVKSGLINEPRVSHFRLALHLGTAFLLLALLWVNALMLQERFAAHVKNFARFVSPSIRTHYKIGLGLLIITVCWGAFTAGLDAGLACSDFPKTCAQWLPQELFFQHKFLRNIVHDAVSVQFMHRVFGTLAFVTLFSLGIRLLKMRVVPLKKLGLSLHILILIQWSLGVGTIQSHVALPVAAMHQLGAVLTLLIMLAIWPFAVQKNQP